MRQILKEYTLATHKIQLAMDDVCNTPIFVVLVDDQELYIGDRAEAVEIFLLACREAIKERMTQEKEIQK